MLREYAVTPQVLLREAYSDPDLYRLALTHLREEIRELGLLRNMADGAWGEFLSGAFGAADIPGKELLKSAVLRRRLVKCPKCEVGVPGAEIEWEAAALEDHLRRKTTGVIVTRSGKARHYDEPIVANMSVTSVIEGWRGSSDQGK